jgi:hypothetical protein
MNSAKSNPALSKTNEMRLYAHWLDGEWQKVAYPVTVAHQYMSLQRTAEGWLKLHALFGTRVALSDIQLTDSPVLPKLFVDPEFRNYVEYDRSFLTLVAYPRAGFEGLKARLGRATRGLDRAQRNGWKTSLPDITVDEIKKFSEPILLFDGQPDTGKWLKDKSSGPGKVIASLPQHRELLEGMLRGICHFTKKTGGHSETPIQAKPRFYTDFIVDVLNSKGLGREEYNALEQVWLGIEQHWVPDSSLRKNRSALLNAMENKEPDRNKWSPELHRIWNTVVHAWNENVSTTVGADRSSISELPGAIVPFRGIISDIVEQERGGLLKARMPKAPPFLSFDPAILTWKQVHEAVRNTRTFRQKFQHSLQKRDNGLIAASGEELTAKLQEEIALKSPTGPPKARSLLLSILTPLAPAPLSYALKAVNVIKQVDLYFKIHSSRLRVLNTLRGYKDELVSALINGD